MGYAPNVRSNHPVDITWYLRSDVPRNPSEMVTQAPVPPRERRADEVWAALRGLTTATAPEVCRFGDVPNGRGGIYKLGQ